VKKLLAVCVAAGICCFVLGCGKESAEKTPVTGGQVGKAAADEAKKQLTDVKKSADKEKAEVEKKAEDVKE